MAETPDGIKIKLHDKQAALKQIGAQLGMFQTKVKLSGDEANRLVDFIRTQRSQAPELVGTAA